MGRSRCRRGRQYGDEWQRQHGGGRGRQTEASIEWGDNQFRFLEVPEKTPIFIFFSKSLPLSEICPPRRPPSSPNGKTASADTIDYRNYC
jgi:hypothetical protein